MSEISWYQCHLFYLLPLLLILCQETQCTKSCESSILARIRGGFLLNGNSNVLPMNSGQPLQLHAKGACSLPLPVLVTVLEKWCPCFSRWHSFLSPSCPWVWQSRGQAHLPSFRIFIFLKPWLWFWQRIHLYLKQKWGQKRQVTDRQGESIRKSYEYIWQRSPI